MEKICFSFHHHCSRPLHLWKRNPSHLGMTCKHECVNESMWNFQPILTLLWVIIIWPSSIFHLPSTLECRICVVAPAVHYNGWFNCCFLDNSELAPACHDAHRQAVRAAALLMATLFADLFAGLVSSLFVLDSYLVFRFLSFPFVVLWLWLVFSRIYSRM
jgi:hypothetical protein